jgi:hypothetical protein
VLDRCPGVGVAVECGERIARKERDQDGETFAVGAAVPTGGGDERAIGAEALLGDVGDCGGFLAVQAADDEPLDATATAGLSRAECGACASLWPNGYNRVVG